MEQSKQDKPETATPQAPRRSFLLKLWAALGAVATAQLGWVAWSFIRFGGRKPAPEAPGSVITAGKVEGFAPGTVTAFARGRFYLVRLSDGGFLALHRRCPHLGCTLVWEEKKQQFLCPCHASAFDIRGGLLRSPASRSMDTLAVTIDNGRVRVDTGRSRQRGGVSPDEVVYAGN
jgi:cytochrome b6-f complex iron-sulfur subunit